MQKAVFPIQSHADITKAINYMHTNYTQAINEGKPLRVVIDQKEDKLSDAQRRLYWLWMTEYGKQRGLDKEEASAFFKYKYLSIIYNRDNVGEYPETFKVMRDLKKSGASEYEPLRQFVSNRMSITEATTKQTAEYLTVPDDLMWVMQK